jgi:NTP pyrophosphatase (non-canonical NTP hydrolase)
MITGKDLEDMGYFDQFDLNKPENSTVLADYTDWVEKKIVTTGDDRLIENTLGLVGEAGEVAEKIKKKIRDRNKVSSEEIVKELGDVLFYVTALANHFGENLAIVMEKNVAKLDDREKRGTLQGSGDNR